MRIRHLPDQLINRIAAGEVVERPSAAVKELVENAIDAQASRIEVELVDGGKGLILVRDNGVGMGPDDLVACLDRHATSKLPDDDLLNISYLGFRGEALPSIASVSKMRIATRARGGDAYEITATDGHKSDAQPSAHPEGTLVEVRDLFHSTPARLKFLKNSATEYASVKDMLQRLALVCPSIAFRLTHNGQVSFHYPVLSDDPEEQSSQRLRDMMGNDFLSNAIPVHAERNGMLLSGRISRPVFNTGSGQKQFLFVNGRAVRDKQLLGAVRAGYMDVLAGDRYPLVVLFLTVPNEQVDVNVHPAKAEVRFQDAGGVRGLIVSAIRHALHDQEIRPVTSLTDKLLGQLDRGREGVTYQGNYAPSYRAPSAYQSSYGGLAESQYAAYQPAYEPAYQPTMELPVSARVDPVPVDAEQPDYPLGAARAQIHENYIIAQTKDGIVIVDQHAAHERLVYERLKKAREDMSILRQGLLTPEIVTLDDTDCARLLAQADLFAQFGLEIEPFGAGAIAVRSVPAILASNLELAKLLQDLADDIAERDLSTGLEERINHVLATMACHGSVRSGKAPEPLRDERPSARDGANAALGPMQSRAPDFYRALA